MYLSRLPEPILLEYKLYKKFKFFSEIQIRDCIYKRSGMQLKILASKTMLSYINLILYEANMYKMVFEREKISHHNFNMLKEMLIRRIMNLYREGLQEFSKEQRLWDHFLNFAKKVVPNKATSIYDDMLKVLDINPNNWCQAGMWAYHYDRDLMRVHSLFQRGLKRNPQSPQMYLVYSEILLREAGKKFKASHYNNNHDSEVDLGLERVARLYRESKKRIEDIDYFLKFLNFLEAPKVVKLTTGLQHTIIVHLQEKYPREESLWDALAQRELRGLSMTDLPDLARPVPPPPPPPPPPPVTPPPTPQLMAALTPPLSPVPALADEDENKNINEGAVFNNNNDGDDGDGDGDGYDEDDIETDDDFDFDEEEDINWDDRPLARRIKLCCEVYRTAMKTLRTHQICTYYVNAMLKLNENLKYEGNMKRSQLQRAFKMGHDMDLLVAEHYQIYIEGLCDEPYNDFQRAIDVLTFALERNPYSSDLYVILLGIYICASNEEKIEHVFRMADGTLGPDSFPIWQRVILYYTVNLKALQRKREQQEEDKQQFKYKLQQLEQIYTEACTRNANEFFQFRGDYLQFSVDIGGGSINKARQTYARLSTLSPQTMGLHKKMIDIETRFHTMSSDRSDWRTCHENLVKHFGRNHPDVWLDYIQFERDYGDEDRAKDISDRAKATLHPKAVRRCLKKLAAAQDATA